MAENHSCRVTVSGEYPEYALVDDPKIKFGRKLNDVDNQQHRKVCVVGTRIVEELFPQLGKDGNPCGRFIQVDGVYYRIVGVSGKSASGISIGGNAQTTVHMPFLTMQQTYNIGDRVGDLIIGAPADRNIGDVEEEVMRFIRSRHRDVSPDDSEALLHVNLAKQFAQISNLFTGIDVLIWLVGLGTLLAGIIGISNIMLVIVKERTQEIGIKRAIGATPGSIIRQIMTEAVMITVVAGYLGLVLGVLINEGLGAVLASSDTIFLNPGINLGVGLICLAILIVAGAAAGLLPALRAVKIKPIDAIREE